ncbi:MAG: hypothetical protein K0B10_05140 [Vicingaceae bacterium]|nr:hypothetical protein [Vicingaceae bacterium]
MAKNKKYKLSKEFFIAEKTSDVFMEVEFEYGTQKWKGLLPKFLKFQGLDLTEEDFYNSVEESYNKLNPKNRQKWITESDDKWSDYQKNTQTYKVLKALYSGNWECRVCGPVPTENPQPAARLSVLKKQGYIIGSKRRPCTSCSKKTMHDILIMLPKIQSKFEDGNELRASMSEKLKERIKKILGKKEVCFNVKRTSVELIIDHKFPSQRWIAKESVNSDDMSVADIRRKFQLLNNQTNMWKSRYCDTCVKIGKRGDFMGIKWYYQGDENWNGTTENDEKGCVGCPWYDLELWKIKLKEKL